MVVVIQNRAMNAEQLARALGGKRAGRQFVACCPAHADRNPSLIIYDGHTAPQVRCLAGCQPIDIIKVLAAAGLWSTVPFGTVDAPHDDAEAKRNADLALMIWQDALDAAGTPAEAYLWPRGLCLPADRSALRFHPRCPRGRDRQPALVAAMCPLKSSAPVAIQRIYLKPDGSKDGAMMLGPAGGAAMKLTSHFNTFWDELSFCPRLHVCEGLETGLALMQQGYTPLWALGSAGAIERMPVLFGVGKLVICADNDPTGLRAAEICAARWNAPTHQRAVIWRHEKGGCDFADEVAP